MAIDVTWLSWVTLAVVGYYALIVSVSAISDFVTRRRAVSASAYEPLVVLVIPARNEELVIDATLATLDRLTYERRLVLVMNDGSTDATSETVRSFAGRSRVAVVDREAPDAGRGKGDVLNHALRVIAQMRATDAQFAGVPADQVIIGVMDADGQLEASALDRVVPLFADPTVGAVQIGVRIANAKDSVLTRMQDIEFVGFSGLVQHARNVFGSVGLGGNGQFVRFSTLESLGRDPWTECLSEDLDLSLTIVCDGWRVRFCAQTYVAQQGLSNPARLLRQRARWVQGHYQCWRHLPKLVTSKKVALRTKVDLSLYLLLISFVLLITFGAGLTLAAAIGLVDVRNGFAEMLGANGLGRLGLLTLSFGPALAFIVTYQRRATDPLRLWELPAYAAFFCFYGYHWVIAQAWALGRMACRRADWSKTPRVAAEVAV